MAKKVLSIDDSSTTRKIIQRAIEALGYEFLEAADGASGLEVLKKNYTDIGIILLDWNMPGMNGIEFLEAFNSNGLYHKIPIIMVTTEAEKGNVVKALKLGVKNYILKPFTNEELATKVSQCLGRS